MNTRRKGLERTRGFYLPLNPTEQRKVQAIADREQRSLGSQMRFWVLERLAALEHQNQAMDHRS